MYCVKKSQNPGEMASILTQTTPFILLATNMENRWPGLSGGSIVMVGDEDYFYYFGYNDTDEISMWPIVMDHALSHIYHHVFFNVANIYYQESGTQVNTMEGPAISGEFLSSSLTSWYLFPSSSIYMLSTFAILDEKCLGTILCNEHSASLEW